MRGHHVPTREGDFVPRTVADKNPTRYEPGEVVAPGIRKRTERVERPVPGQGNGGSGTFSREARKLRTQIPGDGGRALSRGDLLAEVEKAFNRKPEEEKSEE